MKNEKTGSLLFCQNVFVVLKSKLQCSPKAALLAFDVIHMFFSRSSTQRRYLQRSSEQNRSYVSWKVLHLPLCLKKVQHLLANIPRMTTTYHCIFSLLRNAAIPALQSGVMRAEAFMFAAKSSESRKFSPCSLESISLHKPIAWPLLC